MKTYFGIFVHPSFAKDANGNHYPRKKLAEAGQRLQSLRLNTRSKRFTSESAAKEAYDRLPADLRGMTHVSEFGYL